MQKNAKISLLFLFFLSFMACQKKAIREYTFGEFSPNNIPQQEFTFETGKAADFTTKSGVLIHLEANSFDVEKGKTAKLVVREVISRYDMLRSGIQTVTEDGQILESGGMIRLLTEPRLPINTKIGIHVKIPTVNKNYSMQLYTADLDNGGSFWKNPQRFADYDSAQIRLEQGKILFLNKCASCHNPNLKDKATGPALAGVTRVRTREWLYRFTKNNAELIMTGDEIANCHYLEYDKSNMTAFPNMTDQENRAIYDWITQKSEDENLCTNEQLETFNCTAARLRRTDTTSNANIQSQNRMIYDFYELSISSYEWINCDRLLQPTSNTFLRVTADKKTPLVTYLIFRDRKVLLPLSFDEVSNSYYYLDGSEEQFYLPLPRGENIIILSYSEKMNDKRMYVIENRKIEAKNDIKLALKPIDEADFRALLKTL